MPFNVRKKLLKEDEYQSQSECPKYICEEVLERHFLFEINNIFA